MDLNSVKKNLKKCYNCMLINTIPFANNKFVKGIEKIENGIRYRYFKILEDDNLEEIQDECLLNYFKRLNETYDKNNY